MYICMSPMSLCTETKEMWLGLSGWRGSQEGSGQELARAPCCCMSEQSTDAQREVVINNTLMGYWLKQN